MKRQSSVLFCLLAGCLPAFADTSRFEGQWTDPQSQSITSLEIRNVAGTLRLHVFGKCVPRDCDWGDLDVQTYAPGVDQNLKDTVEALTAEFHPAFKRTILVLYPAEQDRLRVETFTVFTDSSGRLPYHTVQMLNRQTPAQSAGSANLVEPVQVSPPRGSVFSVNPRDTTLQWSVVPGAVRYGVEVDCLHCCQKGKWCADVGGQLRSAVVDSPTYTFNFVGAQPGRWRVWAVGPNGEAGPKTEWWDFRYTR